MAVKKITNVSEIEIGKTYLCRVYINAKSIPFRPVKFNVLDVIDGKMNFETLIDSNTRNNFIYVDENGSINNGVVKNIGNWIATEKRKNKLQIDILNDITKKLSELE